MESGCPVWLVRPDVGGCGWKLVAGVVPEWGVGTEGGMVVGRGCWVAVVGEGRRGEGGERERGKGEENRRENEHIHYTKIENYFRDYRSSPFQKFIIIF